ncbi:MAG TPA: hypothetical protein VGO43_07765 [Pyrinomonadaceae bacterium]|jgi:hypothetical protein|nr:hypothetical protein [Pyrinomonadaceae bacterium]
MDPTQMSSSSLYLLIVAVNAALGLIFGLILLFLGRKRGNRRYGVIGLVICFVGGIFLGLFASLPAFLIFTWLIMRRSTVDPQPPPTAGERDETL